MVYPAKLLITSLFRIFAMKISDYRKMRIIILFDLPSVEKEDISINQKFTKKLKKLGFICYNFQYTQNQ